MKSKIKQKYFLGDDAGIRFLAAFVPGVSSLCLLTALILVLLTQDITAFLKVHLMNVFFAVSIIGFQFWFFNIPADSKEMARYVVQGFVPLLVFLMVVFIVGPEIMGML